MNQKQAVAFAKKRWGKTGDAIDRGPRYPQQGMRYMLGHTALGLFFDVCAWGENWQAAVDSARQAMVEEVRS